MKVLFVLAGDKTQASTRLRIIEALPYLHEHGISTSHISPTNFSEIRFIPKALGYLLSIFILSLRAPFYDIIFLQKLPLPGFYIRALKIINCKVIFDFDDAIYLEGPEETGGRIRRKFLNDSISESAQTIVGSPILAEYAHNYTNNVRCIPTPIPKENYVNRQSIKSNDGTLLVWIGYPENVRYLKTISGPITTILDQYEDVQLRIITADSSSVDLFSGRNDVEFCEWSLDTALDNLAEGNIGVRPLINDEWTQAKGGFTSVVEMMAIGMPVVVTPIGLLKEFVEDGVSGFHASTDDEWETALSQLVEDEELRDRMGNNAITAVDKKGLWTTNYSEKLIHVLESVID